MRALHHPLPIHNKVLNTVKLCPCSLFSKLTVIQFGNAILLDGLENELLKVERTGRAANKPAEHLSGKQPEKLFTHYISCQWKED